MNWRRRKDIPVSKHDEAQPEPEEELDEATRNKLAVLEAERPASLEVASDDEPE